MLRKLKSAMTFWTLKKNPVFLSIKSDLLKVIKKILKIGGGTSEGGKIWKFSSIIKRWKCNPHLLWNSRRCTLAAARKVEAEARVEKMTGKRASSFEKCHFLKCSVNSFDGLICVFQVKCLMVCSAVLDLQIQFQIFFPTQVKTYPKIKKMKEDGARKLVFF